MVGGDGRAREDYLEIRRATKARSLEVNQSVSRLSLANARAHIHPTRVCTLSFCSAVNPPPCVFTARVPSAIPPCRRSGVDFRGSIIVAKPHPDPVRLAHIEKRDYHLSRRNRRVDIRYSRKTNARARFFIAFLIREKLSVRIHTYTSNVYFIHTVAFVRVVKRFHRNRRVVSSIVSSYPRARYDSVPLLVPSNLQGSILVGES